MKRKIYDEMLRWKHDEQGQSALMIDGARRIGKSYIVEKFAQNEYRSHIIVDFNNADDDLLDIFNRFRNLFYKLIARHARFSIACLAILFILSFLFISKQQDECFVH